MEYVERGENVQEDVSGLSGRTVRISGIQGVGDGFGKGMEGHRL